MLNDSDHEHMKTSGSSVEDRDTCTHEGPESDKSSKKTQVDFPEKAVDAEKQLVDWSESPPPDGGLRAWLVVVGVSFPVSKVWSIAHNPQSFFGCFSTFGYVNSWGVCVLFLFANLVQCAHVAIDFPILL